ncbi:MAG TPA: hypothetical protein VHS26_05560 [Solirubrobacteraceae bacterium]|jgi:hypothetical protein|nr:hypothetical protein [Solirubrobacteraceae bacterium]
MSSLARVIKLASLALCLVVIASFALFVINRTSDASAHQQQEVNGETTGGAGEPPSPIAPDNGGRKGSARRTIDEVAEAVESPFAALTEGSSSEWVIHSVQLAVALLVYGFGLGYVARTIRVRT